MPPAQRRWAAPAVTAAPDSCDLVIEAPRAVCDGAEAARSIGITDGRIVAVEPAGPWPRRPRVIELGPDAVLLPGLVDTHVHVCEPGNTEWEGFADRDQGGRGRRDHDPGRHAAGQRAHHRQRRAPCRSSGRRPKASATSMSASGAGSIPGNLAELAPLHEAGVLGFKCFLADSGSDDFPPVTPGRWSRR